MLTSGVDLRNARQDWKKLLHYGSGGPPFQQLAADSVLGIYVRETLLLIAPTATSTPNNIKSGNTVARKVNSGDTTEVELSAWQLKQQMIKKHGENPQEIKRFHMPLNLALLKLSQGLVQALPLLDAPWRPDRPALLRG